MEWEEGEEMGQDERGGRGGEGRGEKGWDGNWRRGEGNPSRREMEGGKELISLPLASKRTTP